MNNNVPNVPTIALSNPMDQQKAMYKIRIGRRTRHRNEIVNNVRDHDHEWRTSEDSDRLRILR